MEDAHTLAGSAGGQAVRRRERQMWMWVGGVFAICLVLFLVRSSDPLAEAEHGFQRLLPQNRIIEYPLNPADVPRMASAQTEFARHGSNAVTVTRRHLQTLLSRRTNLSVSLRYRFIPEVLAVNAFDEWATEAVRCALALESMGEQSAPVIPELASSLFHELPLPNRRVGAGFLLGYIGPQGEPILLAGLTNSNPRIRAASVDGLRNWLFRQSTDPNRVLPISVDARTWAAATNQHGSSEWRTDDWIKWGNMTAWMFETNGVWLLSAHFQEMQSPSLARRLASTDALANMLKTNRTGFASVRSNFVSACLEVLTDPEPSERGRVAAALASAGTSEPRVLAALERTLSDPNRMVREDATNALRKLGREQPQHPEAPSPSK